MLSKKTSGIPHAISFNFLKKWHVNVAVENRKRCYVTCNNFEAIKRVDWFSGNLDLTWCYYYTFVIQSHCSSYALTARELLIEINVFHSVKRVTFKLNKIWVPLAYSTKETIIVGNLKWNRTEVSSWLRNGTKRNKTERTKQYLNGLKKCWANLILAPASKKLCKGEFYQT